MQRFLVLAVLVLTPPGGSAAELPARTQKESPWLTDYQAAKTAARQSGKPLLVVFR